ncbi:uncharacterized protein [Apostichopus japonicus]|uniref:Np19-somatostatin-like n=1 Tax=Stichopus japonicus TaxID=307972 RepID=A0A2Z4C015_STIJA|nr:np19-somatostatin-like precursor [Apostichopus japonicus]
MSWRAGVLLCATVLSCWFVSLTSAHTWDSDTDVFEDEVDQEPLLSGVDESMLRSLIIRKFTDRIRNSMKILEDMDLNTELADPETTYRRQEPWSSQTSGLLSTDKISAKRGGACIGRFVPILHKCVRKG